MSSFDRRADSYETGVLGRWHAQITRSVAELVLTRPKAPRSVLDIGCATGQLLRLLADALPDETQLTGVDPVPAMAARARSAAAALNGRIAFIEAGAEALPLATDSVELIVSCLSFDHWADQQAGLTECARVLEPDGMLLLVDLIAAWLAPTVRLSRRRRARTPRGVAALLGSVSFRPISWRQVAGLGPLPLVQAVFAQPTG